MGYNGSDLRVRKTRAALMQALMELMQKKALTL